MPTTIETISDSDGTRELTAKHYSDGWCVEDPAGGTWWPTERADSVEALRAAYDTDAGDWKS
jgi:hypothetical protein